MTPLLQIQILLCLYLYFICLPLLFPYSWAAPDLVLQWILVNDQQPCHIQAPPNPSVALVSPAGALKPPNPAEMVEMENAKHCAQTSEVRFLQTCYVVYSYHRNVLRIQHSNAPQIYRLIDSESQ